MCEVMPILTDVLVDYVSRAVQSINRMTHKYLRAFILNITYETLCCLHTPRQNITILWVAS